MVCRHAWVCGSWSLPQNPRQDAAQLAGNLRKDALQLAENLRKDAAQLAENLRKDALQLAQEFSKTSKVAGEKLRALPRWGPPGSP